MSHVTEVKTHFKHLEDIEAATTRLGGKLIRNQRHYRWYGRWVGDTPMPAGMTLEDMGKCDHAIRFPQTDYEVGVRQQDDGTYTLAWDYWGPGGLLKYMGNSAGDAFTQAYAVEATKRAACNRGHYVTETVRTDGSIEVEVVPR